MKGVRDILKHKNYKLLIIKIKGYFIVIKYKKYSFKNNKKIKVKKIHVFNILLSNALKKSNLHHENKKR